MDKWKDREINESLVEFLSMLQNRNTRDTDRVTGCASTVNHSRETYLYR